MLAPVELLKRPRQTLSRCSRADGVVSRSRVVTEADPVIAPEAVVHFPQIFVGVERIGNHALPSGLTGTRCRVRRRNGLIHDVRRRCVEETGTDDVIGLRSSGRQSGSRITMK